MGSEERARSDLFRSLERTLGEEAASANMERLPPRPWTEIVTKSDLAEFRSHVDARFDDLESRLGDLESRLDALESRLDALESRLDALESRMGDLESRMDRLELRLLEDAQQHQDQLLSRTAQMEQRLLADAELREERVTGNLRAEMNTLVTTQTRTIAFTLLGAIAAHSAALIAALRLA